MQKLCPKGYGYLANPWQLNSSNSGFAILSFVIHTFKHCHQYNYTTHSVNRKLSKTYFTSFIFKIYKGKYELNIDSSLLRTIHVKSIIPDPSVLISNLDFMCYWESEELKNLSKSWELANLKNKHERKYFIAAWQEWQECGSAVFKLCDSAEGLLQRITGFFLILPNSIHPNHIWQKSHSIKDRKWKFHCDRKIFHLGNVFRFFYSQLAWENYKLSETSYDTIYC